MWANWELKRRDALLQKVRVSESKANRKSLRDSPLFQHTLFNSDQVRDLHNRLVARLRDDLILSAARPSSSQMRQQPSSSSSHNKKQKYSQPSRGARGGSSAGPSNRGRGSLMQQNNRQPRDSSQDSSSDSGSNRRGKSKGKGPAHKRKGGRGRK